MSEPQSGGAKPNSAKTGSAKAGILRPVENEASAGGRHGAPQGGQRPADYLTIGKLLAQTRQKFGQDLAQVAQALRIKPTYIQAIEQDRHADLPGLAYAVGFVRSYGDYLGLDGKSLVQRYKDEAQGINRAPDLHFPSLAQEAKVPTGAIILVSLILLGVAYAGWTYFSRETGAPPSVTAALTVPEQKPATSSSDATAAVASEQPAPVITPAPAVTPAPSATTATGGEPAVGTATGGEGTASPAPSSGETTTFAAAPSAVEPAPTTAPATTPAAPTAPSGSLGAPLSAPLAEAPDGSGTATIVSGAESGTTVSGIPSAPTAPAETQQAAAPADGGSRVVLRATQDSWIRISDAKDQPVMTQVLRAGESYAVPDQKGLVLLTGNAGGLTIELDGKALPPLGASGAVKRNIALDPDKLAGSLN